LSDSPTKSIVTALVLFRDIALLRRGPEELPVSWLWLFTTIVMQVVLGVVIGSILPEVPSKPGADDHSIALLAIDVIVPLLWGAAILHLVSRPERYRQMMTAVFGAQLVLQPLVVTGTWAMLYFPKDSGGLLLAQALVFALSVWLIVIQARIVRAATDWPVFGAVAMVIVQSLAASMVLIALFPDMAELLKQAQ
jgi:hypothetical protein